MNHCMVDLETWGTKPGAAIRSIGAKMFDLDGGLGREFYLNIDEESCLDAGLDKFQDTVDWWNHPSRAEAQKQLLVNPVRIEIAIAAFRTFYTAQGAKYVWAHGAPFDPVLWEAACIAIGEEVPWKFQNLRDTRTWYSAHKFNPRTIKREGVHHNALDDCKYQIQCVQTACKSLSMEATVVSATETHLKTGDIVQVPRSSITFIK
jgi:3'-5' exoribonuclease-like protein